MNNNAHLAEEDQANNTQMIRKINDQFRRTFFGGSVMLTSGITSLGANAQRAILSQVREFKDFGPTNDPHGEHDFGSFAYQGETIIFKIDYYDASLTMGSNDPADISITKRVLTILLADEW